LFEKFEGFELFKKFEGFELFEKFEGFIILPVPERVEGVLLIISLVSNRPQSAKIKIDRLLIIRSL
jgi:hypothetical protein